MKKKTKNVLFAPPFYVVLFVFAIIGLGYMMLLGVPQNNIGLIAVSLIFGFLFLSGLLVVQHDLRQTKETFTASAQSFTLGFTAWFTLSSLKYISPIFAVFSFPAQATLSTIAEEIPPFWQFINTVIMAPIVEEIFWGLALPIIMFSSMDELGKKEFKFLSNRILQFFIVIVVGTFTFAAFHTSATQLGFFIAAMLFRTIQIIVFFGDKKYNLIPQYAILFSFLVGTHMANNFAEFGVRYSYNILISNIFGWIVLITFVSIFAIGIRGFLNGKK